MDAMNLLDPGRWLTAAFYTVLRASLLACPVIILIAAARLLLRDRLPAKWIYALWLLVPLRLLLPWTPDSSISIYNALNMPAVSSFTTTLPLTAASGTSTVIYTSVQTAYSDQLNHNGTISGLAVNDEPLSDKPALVGANRMDDAESNVTYEQPGKASSPRFFKLVLVSAWIWLFGSAAALALIIRVNIRFARELSRYAAELHDPAINKQLIPCMRLLGIQRRVRIYCTDRIQSPALTGIVRPKLLLPASIMQELDERRLRHILLHELSHWKRNDLYVNAMMQLLLAVHWFNPLLYFAYTRMREDQELACDSLALSRLHAAERRSYALTLIHLLEYGVSNTPGRFVHTANMLSSKVFWKRRIRMIQARTRSGLRHTMLGMTAMVLIAGCSFTGGQSDKPAGESRGPSMENEALSSIRLASVEAERAAQPAVELLAEIDGAKVYGAGTVIDSGGYLYRPIKRYEELTVQLQGRSYTYPWEITVNKEAAPQLKLQWSDVNQDGQDELIVVTTSNPTWSEEGSYYRQSLHIIRPKDGSEFNIPDPVSAAKLRFTPSLAFKDGNTEVYLDTGNGKLHRSLGQTNFGPDTAMKDNLVIGRNVYMEYYNGMLWAGVSGTLENIENTGFISSGHTSFVVQYNTDDMSVSSVSLNDSEGWEVIS